MLSNENKITFERDGYFIIPKFYDLELEIRPIQYAIYKIINLVSNRHGVNLDRKPFNGNNFDNGFLELIKINRTFGAEIYDLVKEIPAFLRLICASASEQLFCELRNTSFAGIGTASYGIRIDNPNEEKYRSQWHQEFLFQPQSIDGLVFWTPLIEITPEIGPVIICSGSHKNGLYKYTKNDKYSSKSGPYKISIKHEENIVAPFKKIAPLSKPGDLIVMDFLTIHQSGFNISNRARWSVQSRFFNFLDPIGMKIGWKGSVTSGVDIEEIFPENFV